MGAFTGIAGKLCCPASRNNEANHFFANDTSVQLNLQSNYCSLKSPQTMLEEGTALTSETTQQRSPEVYIQLITEAFQ